MGIDGNAMFTRNSAGQLGGEKRTPSCIVCDGVQATTIVSWFVLLEEVNVVVIKNVNKMKRHNEHCYVWALSRFTESNKDKQIYIDENNKMDKNGRQSIATVVHTTRYHITATSEASTVNHRAAEYCFCFVFVSRTI